MPGCGNLNWNKNKGEGSAEKYRCMACCFPKCAVPDCASQWSSAVPRSMVEWSTHGSWVCKRNQCQHMKKKIQCTVCGVRKMMLEFEKNQRAVKGKQMCFTCQYPTCFSCGSTHPKTERPVRADHPGRIGSRWYCKQCKGHMSLQPSSKKAKMYDCSDATQIHGDWRV